MADLVQDGDAIEGDAVVCASRKPLKDYGLDTHPTAGRCYRFAASFDVRAQVSVAGAGTNRFFPNASNSPEDEIVADKALILSLDRKPGRRVVPGSGTHKTNENSFSGRTGIQITLAHEELKNAIAARVAEERKAEKSTG
jgi:hypothetical protein